MGGLEGRLDALCRRQGHGLAGGNLRARPPRDVAGRINHTLERRDGAVPGNIDGVGQILTLSAKAALRAGRIVYCFDSVIENSPLRMRAARPSTNFATASSP